MELSLGSVLSFVLALIISTLAIYVVGKVASEHEGMMTAFLAAIIGTVIYILVFYFLGFGLLAAALTGIFWLIALRALYKIGWVKALLTTSIIWVLIVVLTAVIGAYLPTLTGPLLS